MASASTSSRQLSKDQGTSRIFLKPAFDRTSTNRSCHLHPQSYGHGQVVPLAPLINPINVAVGAPSSNSFAPSIFPTASRHQQSVLSLYSKYPSNVATQLESSMMWSFLIISSYQRRSPINLNEHNSPIPHEILRIRYSRQAGRRRRFFKHLMGIIPRYGHGKADSEIQSVDEVGVIDHMAVHRDGTVFWPGLWLCEFGPGKDVRDRMHMRTQDKRDEEENRGSGI
ncbi:hypothetical protein BJ508DRAFT_53606 [Ascobolus immersus RN42]|uniref:Uncharacterized protein n=1 Tax=Ascobolus immersus RN42 TaxID=1160509 RepID=A0A3N4HGL7_ASCIM|nr:hypothetical protein BJ508DRAFT_53606 [Ascobolus immersus RN42]